MNSIKIKENTAPDAGNDIDLDINNLVKKYPENTNYLFIRSNPIDEDQTEKQNYSSLYSFIKGDIEDVCNMIDGLFNYDKRFRNVILSVISVNAQRGDEEAKKVLTKYLSRQLINLMKDERKGI